MLRQMRRLAICIAFSSATLAQQYFPDRAFEDDDDKLNDFRVRWYSDQLNALEEPSLWEASRNSKPAQVYRFLWLRSFHHPVAVRLEVGEDGIGTLTAKMSNGAGGYKPGKLIENHTRAISKNEIQKLLTKLASPDYWRLPSRDSNQFGLDGAEWIIEAVRDGKYKIVKRWSPKMDKSETSGSCCCSYQV
jgi:hypothetical protein